MSQYLTEVSSSSSLLSSSSNKIKMTECKYGSDDNNDKKKKQEFQLEFRMPFHDICSIVL